MGILFRKSIRLGKFAKINLSKNGISGVSFGAGGARIGINRRGTYVGTSLPGTGLSAQYYLNTKSQTNLGYQATIENAYLGTQKVIRGYSEEEVHEKATKQLELWERKEDRERKKNALADLQEQYESDSTELFEEISHYKNILNHTLSVDDKMDWDSNRIPEIFTKTLSKEDFFSNVPKESFFDFLFFWRKNKRIKILAEAEKAFIEAQKEFDKEKLQYETEAKMYNQELLEFKQAFESNEEEAIIEYVTKILNSSEYLPHIARDFDINYNKESKALLVDYLLPSPNDIPSVKELKFIKTTREVREIPFKKSEFEAFYNSIISQITLRTIHEIFESVYTNAIETIIFNGMTNTVDKTTGQPVAINVLSVLINRNQFETIQLAKVDPVACLMALGAEMILPLTKLEPVVRIGGLE